MKLLHVLIGLCLFLALFAGLSKYEDRDALRATDFAATVKIQEKIDRSEHLRLSSLVGNLMEGATFFASPEFTAVVTVVVTAFLFAVSNGNRRWRTLLIPVLLTLIVGGEIVGKTVVHHPSPPFSMIKHPATVFPANYVNEQFSYPSGHAARAVFLAILGLTVFAVRKGKRTVLVGTGIALVGYVVLVAVSRIYLGHHWLSDVLGGTLLGVAFGTPLVLILSADRHETHSPHRTGLS